MARALTATAVATVMVAGALLAPGAAAGAPRRGSEDAQCTITGATAESRSRQSLSPVARGADDLAPSERWLADSTTQSLNTRIQRELGALLGAAPQGKERIADQLRRGLVGYAADDTTQTISVVVTPDVTARTNVAGRLDVVRRAFTGVSAFTPKVAVVTACRSAESLIEADDLIFGRAWHPDAARASFNYELDPADSVFHVSFDARYPEAAEALGKALGDRVQVQLGANRIPTGRYDDGEPHYGGSAVRVGSGSTGSNICSTGFMVRRNSDARRGVVSAAHCFENNQAIYSGPSYVGTAANENVNNHDVIGIYSTTESYAPVIHVDPCSPCTRTVVGDETPSVNMYVCVSGMSSKALCSLKVVNVGGVYCQPEGCVTNLIAAERWDRAIVRAGDSGGPVYSRVGTDDAVINGMIVGQDAYYGGNRMLAETAASVKVGLGVTIVTG
ncbi:hypothetical protein F4553_002775 [Allocatelliglobosispora scoriae]|uniref:Uncharacterized protein n=1 Tax=Allocatelliglobosispora scoriae TaxID=643052 RepID=A0A841BQ26_9ACTN|nr:hypothetical protein [Allocatelliglobosispora scoriae]MBB5869396.1 hypothetical protein [Allocatelliglobosispora scoriae]